MSDDYKQRFVGEYWELNLRIEKLEDHIRKRRIGVLGFVPDSDIHLLHEQLEHMRNYLKVLKDRAIYEKIDLTLNYTPPQQEPEVVEAEPVAEAPKKRAVKK